MARKVFYSFHYIPDGWRAAQIRNAGVLEGNQTVSDNDWETITRGGDQAIKTWINGQLSGKSCVVVLIGSATAGRKWINYEIEQAWNAKKGVVGIYIHNLRNSQQQQSAKGSNPFDGFTVDVRSPFGVPTAKRLSDVVKVYDILSSNSQTVRNTIVANLKKWVDEAINIRNGH